MTKNATHKTAFVFLKAALFISIAWKCHAIDNPDAPDYLGAFQKEAQFYEQQIDDSDSNGRELAEARGRYLKFLDDELNKTYQLLQGKLSEPSKQALLNSQRAWLKFRDSETTFIDTNWTPQNFGSSSALSRHGYRAALTRHRVEQLLAYLKNY